MANVRASMLQSVLLLSRTSFASEAYQTKTQVISGMRDGYDRQTRPGMWSNSGSCAEPTTDNVTLDMTVKHVASINQHSQTYILEGYLRLRWSDARLAYNATACGLSYIVLDQAAWMWTPDVYFEQAVSIKLASSGDGQFFRIQPDGRVIWSRQARIELRCNMGFGRLPFDEQNCLFLAGIYSDLASGVYLRWANVATALLGPDIHGLPVRL